MISNMKKNCLIIICENNIELNKKILDKIGICENNNDSIECIISKESEDNFKNIYI